MKTLKKVIQSTPPFLSICIAVSILFCLLTFAGLIFTRGLSSSRQSFGMIPKYGVYKILRVNTEEDFIHLRRQMSDGNEGEIIEYTCGHIFSASDMLEEEWGKQVGKYAVVVHNHVHHTPYIVVDHEKEYAFDRFDQSEATYHKKK